MVEQSAGSLPRQQAPPTEPGKSYCSSVPFVLLIHVFVDFSFAASVRLWRGVSFAFICLLTLALLLLFGSAVRVFANFS